MMDAILAAKPYIIAEVGSNWLTLDHCLWSIESAKACGADAVKFQLFDEVALYGHGFAYPSWGVQARPPFLPPPWISHLQEKASACGIDFLCTAFSPEFVEMVDPFVKAHKVASSDLRYPQLLEAVARTGKVVLLSTGASTVEEITQATAYFRPPHDSNTRNLILMYCVASYPAKSIDLRILDDLDTLASETRCFGVGFSDHSIDCVGHPVAAAMNPGVLVLEKHFTAFPELDTPDGPHSLGPFEFKLMIDHIRGSRGAAIGPTYEESEMLTRHNRRLIATCDIEAGEKLKYGLNFGAYRSLFDDTKGMSPFDWATAQGKSVIRTIPRGEPITPEGIE